MLTVEIALPEVEELQKLVADGTEKGFLTYDEIVNGLDDVELTKEQVEDFYTYLIDHNIELVEGEQHKTPPHEQPQPEEDKLPPAPKLDLTVEPSLDSLRLYLREIGKVPLLTADQEVSLAKRIERGDMAREDADDRGEPPPRRLDREGLPRARPQLPRPDPGRLASASSARSRSSTTARATSSRRTRPGGSGRRSRARSPTRRARSASRCTWSRS